jgi:hypothetical protein
MIIDWQGRGQTDICQLCPYDKVCSLWTACEYVWPSMALLNTATGTVFIVEFLGVHSFEDFVTPCSLLGFSAHQTTRCHTPDVLFIIIIIIHFSYFAAVQPVLKTIQSPWPSTSYSLSCQKLPTVQHAFSITAFCTGIYRAWRRLSSFNLSCSLYGIIPFVDNTKWYRIDRVRLPHTYKLFFQVCVLLEFLGNAVVLVV